MKPFYEFSSNIFRNELLMEYIIPVAKWFMVDDKPSGYLLPQASGSFWECSLAIDFLLRVSTVEGQHDLLNLKLSILQDGLLTACMKKDRMK